MTAKAATTTRLDAPWLAEGTVAQVLAVLDRDGEEARVVGGAVRNALLNVRVSDVDIATTAIPADVMKRTRAAGFKPVPTGIAHGTVTVVANGKPYEVTTLRQDVATDGRHAKVAFGRDWSADAQRRDFTMNALSASADGVVHDYASGLADITARRVRFIGDPATRIAEDYLRILRFFRFHAAYGEGLPDAAGLAACISGRAGLATLSRERVRMELLKLLLARHVVPALAVMSETGLLIAILGGVPLLGSVSNLIKLEHATDTAPDPVRRLGALAVVIMEDAERLRERLRLANAEHEQLLSMADRWWRMTAHTGSADSRALLYRIGRERYRDRVLLAWSRAGGNAADVDWKTLAALPQRWSAPAFPLKAADFSARGVPKGPALGEALRRAEDAWIAADFPLDPSATAGIADMVARES